MHLATNSGSNSNVIYKNNSDKQHKLLTLRELEIVKCLLTGKSAKEIARLTLISHRTVEKHIENIKNKFSCKTKTELISKICAPNLPQIFMEGLP